MKRRNKIITIALAFTVVLFVAGVSALAVGAFGSRTDPLVTLSYIDETVKPEVMAYADDAVDELSDVFDDMIADYTDDLNARLDGATVGDKSDVFSVVNLSANDTMTCGVGTELMVRSGQMQTSSGMALSDTSSGSAVNGGSSLSVNHMYVVTSTGVLTANDNVVILVKGEYTIN